MRVKIAEKASSKWQKMQTTLSRNCCSKNAPKLSAVIHCLQWITAKIALKMQWDFGHSGNLQNLQGNYLQCTYLDLRDSFLNRCESEELNFYDLLLEEKRESHPTRLRAAGGPHDS